MGSVFDENEKTIDEAVNATEENKLVDHSAKPNLHIAQTSLRLRRLACK